MAVHALCKGVGASGLQPSANLYIGRLEWTKHRACAAIRDIWLASALCTSSGFPAQECFRQWGGRRSPWGWA